MSQQEKEHKSEVYKKWFKTKGKQGFLSIRDFLQAGKFVVDIGEQKTGENMHASQTYINFDDMITILDRLYTGRYKKEIILYGGGSIDGNPVSRMFKVEAWNNSDGKDAWAFKNGIFAAEVTGTGAYQPKMDQPIAVNLIKVSRDDVALMRVRCNVALNRFTAVFDPKNPQAYQEDNIFKFINGEARA